MVTATGLGSGLDVTGLVTQIVNAERAGTDLQLTRQTSKLNAKISAFGSLKSAIAGFQSSLSSINTLSSFDKKSVTLSSSDALTAVATSSAVPNDYSIEVQRLATSQALASGVFADRDKTAVGSGTLTFRFGNVDYDAAAGNVDGFSLKPDSKITTITIDSSNNTLEGIMKAVNDANFGVKASVVNDGNGYRLLFTATATGAENGLEIQVDDLDGENADAEGLSRLAFNSAATHMQLTKEASDARFSINGLAVSSASNSVSSAIPGLTLNLKAASSGPVQLSVGKDTSSATTALNTFISGYNNLVRTVKTLTKYDAASNTAGMLLGDFTVRAVMSQVDGIMRNAVSGIVGEFGSLSEIGLKTNDVGELELDTASFRSKLESDPRSIQALFTALGVPSDPDVRYLGAGNDTATGAWDLHISALASGGYYSAASVLPPDFSLAPLVIDGDNDNFSLAVDGLDIGEIRLTQGSYSSAAELAAELEARINGASAMVEAGKRIKVTHDAASNSFVLTSAMLGNSSNVSFTAVGATVAATLGFSIGEGQLGTDVAGTIGGVAAKGAGNVLTAADDSAAAGLRLEIGGNAIGARGSIGFSRGISSQLDLLLKKVLDEESGLSTRLENLNDGLKQVQKKKEQMEARWEQVRDRYTRQFNALDTLLAGLQSTSKYLETQLASLPGARKD
jgi:flagellar hook-associated protein 2